ncbi:hypothetical protein FIV07_12250 [Mycobacterium sp. THAF192]|nr:hypothetical protein FIV07_12250 [Mycobacterium sp. THAF192]
MTTHVTVTVGGSCVADRSPQLSVPIVLTVMFLAWVSGLLWWLLAAASLAAAAHWLHQQARTQNAEHAAIAARADQQHAWVLAGDPRGTYG